MAKKNQIIEGIVSHSIFPNKGVVYYEEQPIYVTGAFKGQHIKARLFKRKKGTWEAQLLEVLENPTYFVEAPCSYFGMCGGCSAQNLDYDYQSRYL